jgi:hypothetical protein
MDWTAFLAEMALNKPDLGQPAVLPHRSMRAESA